VPCGLQLEAGVTRYRRTWCDEICRIEERAAPVALVAAGSVRAAFRASAQDIAVRKEAAVHRRPVLLQIALLDEARRVESLEEMLGQAMVPRG
jgi:hypothetical protein